MNEYKNIISIHFSYLLIHYGLSFCSIYLNQWRVNSFSRVNLKKEESIILSDIVSFLCSNCSRKIGGTIFCFMDSYYCSEFCRHIRVKDYNKIE